MSHKILCVDDNPLVLATLKRVLESAGCAVAIAETGRDALAWASTDRFAVAVLDYELPDLRGDLLARQLKDLQPWLPMILFSGCVDIPAEAAGSFFASVPKGSPMTLLIEALNEVVRHSRDSSEGCDTLSYKPSGWDG